MYEEYVSLEEDHDAGRGHVEDEAVEVHVDPSPVHLPVLHAVQP